MSTFKWDESHKSDRTELLKGVIPTPQTALHEIEVSPATQEEKSLLYIMYITSCRITEACRVKVEDVVIHLNSGHDLDYINSKNYTRNPYDNTPIDRFDVKRIIITLDNLKRIDKNARKAIPVTNNDLFTQAVWHLIEHMRVLNNPKALFYPKGRRCGWWIFKRYENINKVFPFPHATRHISLSNLSKSGLEASTIKDIAGWSSLSPFVKYVHLNTAYIEKKLIEAYGSNLEKLNIDDGKPLSLTQAASAHLAAYEVGRKKSDVPAKAGPSHKSREQYYKESVIADGDKLVAERTTPQVRYAADQLRKSNPYIRQFNNKLRDDLIKKRGNIVKKSDDSDLLQVV